MIFVFLPTRCHSHTPFACSLPRLEKTRNGQRNGTGPKKALMSRRRMVLVRASSGQDGREKQAERRSFLSPEEAGLVEISGLSSHERFLCRLTISSLNLLRVIAEQEGSSIEELNAGRVCDWFVEDKLKREQNMGSAVLQWDDAEFPSL